MKDFKIIFSDVDGTLLDSRHNLPSGMAQAIRQLGEKGILFVLVSARGPSGLYPIMKRGGFRCPLIAYSGALTQDAQGQVLSHRGLSKPLAQSVIDYIDEQGFDLSWCLYALDQWLVRDRRDPRIIREEQIVRAEAAEGGVADIRGNQASKILCIVSPKQMEKTEQSLKERFPSLNIVRSSDILLEIMAREADKGAAIRAYCARLHIDPARSIAFGDNYNDIGMLEAAGLGILMGNAPEALKKRFAHHTEDNDQAGVLKALKRLGLIE